MCTIWRERRNRKHDQTLPLGQRGLDLKVLLTGSEGFLGSRIKRELESANVEVVALRTRLPKVDDQNLADVDAVIHAAAKTPKGPVSQKDYDETNVIGTKRLIEACERLDIRRFVHISTMAVNLSTDYAIGKRQAEEIVLSSKLDWLILRPSAIYGPEEATRQWLESLRRQFISKVPGRGQGPVHMVHVDDCAAAVVHALKSDEKQKIFNLTGQDVTYREYLIAARAAAGARFMIVPIPLWLSRIYLGADLDQRLNGMRIPGVGDYAFPYREFPAALRETAAQLGL